MVIEIILIVHKVCVKYIFASDEANAVETIEKEYLQLDNYGYYMRGNATEYEKSLFEELKEVLSIEDVVEEDYARIIAKLFISDLFTLSNKYSSSDISSSQYVYSSYQETFELMVKDTIYANIEINLDSKRTQNLPSVTNIEVLSIDKDSFLLESEDLELEAFNIVANISYEEDLGYPTTYEIVMVKNNELLQVVKAQEVE